MIFRKILFQHRFSSSKINEECFATPAERRGENNPQGAGWSPQFAASIWNGITCWFGDAD